jgi:hypothetical protein
MGVYAFYYRDGVISPQDFNNFLVGAAIKDDLSDLKRMDHYFETEVGQRKGDIWKTVYQHWRAAF